MPKYQTTRIVPYAQDEIYTVMMDIEKYPDILPFIQSITIKKKTEDFITAIVEVGIGPLSFSYDCEITAVKGEKIDIIATKGPFKHLFAKWSFKPVTSTTTEVSCFLDSEFTSRSMEMVGGNLFAQQFQRAIEIFENHLKRKERKRPA